MGTAAGGGGSGKVENPIYSLKPLRKLLNSREFEDAAEQNPHVHLGKRKGGKLLIMSLINEKDPNFGGIGFYFLEGKKLSSHYIEMQDRDIFIESPNEIVDDFVDGKIGQKIEPSYYSEIVIPLRLRKLIMEEEPISISYPVKIDPTLLISEDSNGSITVRAVE